MKHGIFALFENLEANETKTFKKSFKIIKLIEKLGFDEAWLSEHHFNNFSLTSSPTVQAAFALAKTKRIKIGVAGFVLPANDTLRLAEDIANLMIISGNRFLCGFAKGSFPIIDKAQGRDPAFNREFMLEKLCDLEDAFEDHCTINHIKDISIRPKVKKPKFYMASAHEDSLKYAANHGHGILASMKMSISELKDLQNRYADIAGFRPEFGVIRAINIAKNKKKSQKEASAAVDFFFKCMRGAMDTNPATFNLVKGSKYEALRTEFFDPKKLKNLL